MKRFITIAVVVVLAGIIAFRLMQNKKTIEARARVEDNSAQVISVNVYKTEKKIAEKKLKMVGTAIANQVIDIKSEVQGKITSLHITLGQRVTKGQALAKIDDRLRALAVDNAEQRVADARQNYERFKNLYEGGAASKAQFDQYSLAYDNARNQLDQAKKELSSTTVTSPISGIITAKQAEEGAFTTMGAPIATVVDISSLKIQLNISEQDVYTLNLGDEVTITTTVFPGVKYHGKVTFISPRGDEAHNYPVELSIENKKDKQLKAGTYVDVAFNKRSNAPTLQIPREALVGSLKDARVYVVGQESTAQLKPILIGNDYGQYLEVIDGLSEGDVVVTSGQINLTNGVKVSIINKQ